MVARGAGRSLRGTARRGGETPPPAPPRPAPASARPPAGREPRHAESRREPPRSAPRGRGAPSARRGWAGAGGVASASGRPVLPLRPASGGRARPPPSPPRRGGRGQGGPTCGGPGRSRLGGSGAPPSLRSAGRPSASARRAQRRWLRGPPGGAGGGEGRGEAAGPSRTSPGTPAAGGTAPAPPSHCGSRPNCAPLNPGRAGTRGVVPFTCRPNRFLPASLHPFVPSSLCPRRDARGAGPAGVSSLPPTAPLPAGGPGESPGRALVTSERSPGRPQAPRVLPRRPKDERGNIAGASRSSAHPGGTTVPHTRPGFPEAGRACQVKGKKRL